ncbi:MAG TPA: AAC(3) family N-acetyltransferase [Roseiflexaceae bacterium]|nr:AAC(3) family N-acetyltransferase [Roseiflexaceae bacterium]HMP42795.1 AAC(3) family N-acetyltransferase [Roseiflexaceae bacterium]
MPEQTVIAQTSEPLTIDSLAKSFRACGVQIGQTIIVHTSLRSLGWVIGGAQAYIQALLQAVGTSGTLMMPTQSWRNLDPESGAHPGVPEHWWPLIRVQWPAYDPATTPTNGMGVVAELFRTWPGARRSQHPTRSFAAIGPNAERLLATHALEEPFGEDSPVGQLYALDGSILLVGVDHESNTSLHLAEYQANYASKHYVQESSAVLVNGVRQWITYSSPNLFDSHDFAALGAAYEAEHQIRPVRIGQAAVRLLRQRPLVDWAICWLEQHRP